MDGEWTEVCSKKIRRGRREKQSYRHNQTNVIQLVKNFFDKELKNIDEYFLKTKPKSVLLYGSCARGDNTEHSDVDIMVIWNYIPDHDLLRIIRNKLMEILGTKVDLVVMKHIKKLTTPAPNDELFISNVKDDAITVFGDDKGIIDFSVKIGKIK